GRFGKHFAEREYATRAITEIAAIRWIGYLYPHMHAAANGKIENELRPILDQVHAFFVAPRCVIPVVAFEGRTHCQEVFDGYFLFARIGVLHAAGTFRQQIENSRVNSAQLLLLNGNADEDIGNALGRGASVAEGAGVAVEVSFVDQLSVTGNEDASNFLEFARTDTGLQLLQNGCIQAVLFRRCLRPIICFLGLDRALDKETTRKNREDK